MHAADWARARSHAAACSMLTEYAVSMRTIVAQSPVAQVRRLHTHAFATLKTAVPRAAAQLFTDAFNYMAFYAEDILGTLASADLALWLNSTRWVRSTSFYVEGALLLILILGLAFGFKSCAARAGATRRGLMPRRRLQYPAMRSLLDYEEENHTLFQMLPDDALATFVADVLAEGSTVSAAAAADAKR
jgi:hypothetical protein